MDERAFIFDSPCVKLREIDNTYYKRLPRTKHSIIAANSNGVENNGNNNNPCPGPDPIIQWIGGLMYNDFVPCSTTEVYMYNDKVWYNE